jgi:hypothetical protein
MMALAKTLGRPPTDAERADFLAALAAEAGGEYVYVAKLPQSEVDASEVWRLRGAGLTLRQIAEKLHCSTSPVRRVLRQEPLLLVSPYEGDKAAA